MRCFPLFFLLLDGPQDITGLGNVRQVDLRLLVALCRLGRGSGRGFPATPQSGAHTDCLVFLHRTGVRFLFRNAHFRENVENDLALDF
jgi:hypothetical protein